MANPPFNSPFDLTQIKRLFSSMKTPPRRNSLRDAGLQTSRIGCLGHPSYNPSPGFKLRSDKHRSAPGTCTSSSYKNNTLLEASTNEPHTGTANSKRGDAATVPSGNKRIDDLKYALGRGSKRNGNHFIEIKEGDVFPDMARCKDCDLNLSCLAMGHVPHTTPHGLKGGRPCFTASPSIEFSYHDSICLTFNVGAALVTDHGMWGYSVTTSRSIRWYLSALHDQGYILDHTRVDELCKTFKKREDDLWLPVN